MRHFFLVFNPRVILNFNFNWSISLFLFHTRAWTSSTRHVWRLLHVDQFPGRPGATDWTGVEEGARYVWCSRLLVYLTPLYITLSLFNDLIWMKEWKKNIQNLLRPSSVFPLALPSNSLRNTAYSKHMVRLQVQNATGIGTRCPLCLSWIFFFSVLFLIYFLFSHLLENGSIDEKIQAMKKLITLLMAGERFPGVLMVRRMFKAVEM